MQVPARGPGGRPHLLLEWEGGTLGDMVADAAVAIVLQVRCRRRLPSRRKPCKHILPLRSIADVGGHNQLHDWGSAGVTSANARYLR